MERLVEKCLKDDFLFSEHTNNDFSWNYDFKGQDFTIEYIDFIENAKKELIENENGEKYLKNC